MTTAELLSFARKFPGGADVAAEVLARGGNQDEVMNELRRRNREVHESEEEKNRREQTRMQASGPAVISRGSLGDPYDFSLRSLILGLMPGAERKGREFERTSASKKRDGVTIPGDLANALFAGRGHRMMQRTDITSAAATGGTLIPTDHPRRLHRRAAADELCRGCGRNGSERARRRRRDSEAQRSRHRRVDGRSTTAVPDSDGTYTEVAMSPKESGATQVFTRKLMIQSSPSIEMLVRDDLAEVLMTAADVAAVNGSGADNQPKGLLRQTGIPTVDLGTNGGLPSFAKATEVIGKVLSANAFAGRWRSRRPAGWRARCSPSRSTTGPGGSCSNTTRRR